MQNINRWRSDQFQLPTTLLFGIWSNKSDANLEDSDCTVRMLLFISIVLQLRLKSPAQNLQRLLFKAGQIWRYVVPFWKLSRVCRST